MPSITHPHLPRAPHTTPQARTQPRERHGTPWNDPAPFLPFRPRPQHVLSSHFSPLKPHKMEPGGELLKAESMAGTPSPVGMTPLNASVPPNALAPAVSSPRILPETPGGSAAPREGPSDWGTFGGNWRQTFKQSKFRVLRAIFAKTLWTPSGERVAMELRTLANQHGTTVSELHNQYAPSPPSLPALRPCMVCRISDFMRAHPGQNVLETVDWTADDIGMRKVRWGRAEFGTRSRCQDSACRAAATMICPQCLQFTHTVCDKRNDEKRVGPAPRTSMAGGG
jgi:hypothetical protein